MTGISGSLKLLVFVTMIRPKLVLFCPLWLSIGPIIIYHVL